jgi:hypothetical protein
MRLKALLVGATCLLWGTGVAGGYVALARHTAGAGREASAPASWPACAPIAADPALPTLLVFAHPQCPCTAATVEELNRLLARCADRVATCVFLYVDPALGAEWSHTALRRELEALPGVTVREDPLGAVARAFGAHTSGQTLLYGTDGTLLFSGGITPGRGHAGDSAGCSALLQHVLHDTGPDRAPVYGCALSAPEEDAP